jgi:hypothetical protein
VCRNVTFLNKDVLFFFVVPPAHAETTAVLCVVAQYVVGVRVGFIWWHV